MDIGDHALLEDGTKGRAFVWSIGERGSLGSNWASKVQFYRAGQLRIVQADTIDSAETDTDMSGQGVNEVA